MAVVIVSARCEPSGEDDAPVADKPQTNRRSFGEYHPYGVGLPHQYAPAYHAHYAPAAATYHGHYYHGAPHGYAAAPAHYHLLHGRGYAPGHYYHGSHYVKPVVYQSVVHTYPTATTVVHKPVPVPVAHPVPVPVARPVAVEVPRPYPVPVNRPYPVAVIKPVPVPVAQPYPVTVYKPYPVPVYRPLPVAVQARPAVHYAIRAPLPAVRVVRPAYHPVVAAAAAAQPYAPAYAAPPNYHSYAGSALPSYPATAVPSYPAAALPGYSATGPPHYPGYPAEAPAASASYLQQLAAVRGATAAVGAGGEYEVNEPAQQQTLFQDEYPLLHEQHQQHQQQQDVSITTDVRHHHHHDDGGVQYDQNGDIAGGYPSLTNDDAFKTSLGVPNIDYTGKKK